jgi:hypothetical protein
VKVANVKTTPDPTEGEPARHTGLDRTIEPLGLRASKIRYLGLESALGKGSNFWILLKKG